MPIPFPPDGPQVQAALQKVPTPQLQQYASGQPPQPTGQVAPGPMGAAAQALNARGAMGAANQRQQAMNNNPANSPTIFQQKDMELQQKAQQLAAMGQQMQQQMQQKEQQLGVMGALMAKKAQALQAREQGLAMLPISENMFTAMNGGIVFSRGGGVEGYARRGLVQSPGLIDPLREDRMAEGFTEPGVMDRVSSEEEDPANPLQQSIANIRTKLAQYEAALSRANLPPEKKAELLKAAEEKLTGQYEKYKQGIGGLDEEAAAAIRGKPFDLQRGIAAGLASLPADLRGVRVAGLMSKLAGGVAGERARVEDREAKAAQYLAEAKRKTAAADLAEERGRPDLARKLIADAESDTAKAADVEAKAAKAGLEAETGIAGLQNKADIQEAKLEASKAAAQRSAELREQKLKIEEALAQGRISALQANALTASLNQQMKALELENRNLQTQIQLGNVRSQVQDRVNKALENDPAYFRISNSIDKLMRKDKLSKEEDAKLDLLLEQRNQIVNAKKEEYGVNTLPSSGTMPSQAAKALPNKVSVGGKSFDRPSNFTDEQWRKYIKDTGAKAE